MKRNRHTEEQIITILQAHERGVSVAELARQNGVPDRANQRWFLNLADARHEIDQ